MGRRRRWAACCSATSRVDVLPAPPSSDGSCWPAASVGQVAGSRRPRSSRSVASATVGWNHSTPPGRPWKMVIRSPVEPDEVAARAYQPIAGRGHAEEQDAAATKNATTRKVMIRAVGRRRSVRRGRRPRPLAAAVGAARASPMRRDRQPGVGGRRLSPVAAVSSASTTSTTTTVMLSLPPRRLASVDQLPGRLLRVGQPAQEGGDLVVAHLAGQAVAAQQEAIARDRHRPVKQVDRHLGIDAEGPGHDVAPRVELGLLLGQLALGDQLRDQVVVGGELVAARRRASR